MDLREFILKQLGLEVSQYKRIAVFIDFGNVNYWFEEDRRDVAGNQLAKDQKLIVDIDSLASFVNSFADHARFYYGTDQQKTSSLHLIRKARGHFVVVSKQIQWIRHYLDENEVPQAGRLVEQDQRGKFIRLPKCNFDVEICVDAIRRIEKYDTFCLFSGDSDFAHLLRFLKRNGKKCILVSAGHVAHDLSDQADHHIRAQSIKSLVTKLKTPRIAGRGLDIGSASGGQGSF
ncbi:hypothetical protein A3F28_03595 [Candidatus Uhrbacteria bacterium RIFCSPHIGHO2_12_FULL_57_11]|uniref:NYN domain-containing protein n=2 Tax=Candidatus Uhriibacteriota TaxID=1752732 RepID=A0A1F7UKS9_9BACT|nr:MAG: hypothetical protein A3D72_01265 [Candidatus Uhrbacteria bacterium RIFCSPHIGHO2_02_FULL_57_19]OGL78344.1 MAG: hypothetical protein A3F28_03595 [Candidatus Uhrbacteria bacterium RIFCSPHIGHO2_12_FULL_57_11]